MPVVTAVSQATRASGSLARMASRMASETWSASLSGWPSVTDSDVNRWPAALLAMACPPESPAPARPRHRSGWAPGARSFPYGDDDQINAWTLDADRRGGACPARAGCSPPLRQLDVVDARMAEELAA